MQPTRSTPTELAISAHRIGQADAEAAREAQGAELLGLAAEVAEARLLADQRLAFEQEMREAKVDWRMHVHGNAVHGFANPDAGHWGNPAVQYHQPSDERSWRAMRDLFDETFGGR